MFLPQVFENLLKRSIRFFDVCGKEIGCNIRAAGKQKVFRCSSFSKMLPRRGRAVRWQAKAGVEPPFAGCERPFSLRTFHLNSKISPCNPSLKIHFSRNALFAKTRKNRKIAFAIKKLCEFLDNRPRNLVQ